MILIVDDQTSMCWILSKVLSEAGFSVETVGTGKEALYKVNENEVSVAIVDYRLPDMNGLELFSQIRNLDPYIQAILITSYGSKRLREEALNLGFHSYYDKPFDNLVLISSVIEALESLKHSKDEVFTEEHDISRETEIDFWNILENLSLAVIVVNEDGDIVKTNKAAQTMFGYNERGFLSKTFTDLFHNNLNEYSELLDELKGKRDYIQIENHFLRKDGNSGWAEIMISNFGLSKEKYLYISTVKDITERKELEEHQLIQSEKLLGMRLLAASLAHELGNPLSIMSSTLQYVGDKLSNEGQQQLSEAIDTIMDNIGEMHRILRRLSDFTSSQELSFESVDILSILSQTLSFVSKKAEVQKIEIISKFDKNIPNCEVDQNEIKQLFLNLVKNAIEAMSNGGKLKVKTYLLDSEDKVGIEISDTGTGIDELELQSIFKPFHSTKPGGMGLGLASCRRVVEEHGGEITVESEVGKGSTFRVILPIRQE